LALPVRIEVETRAGKALAHQMESANLCAGGVFFKTRRRIAEGLQVKAEIFLPIDCPELPSGYRAGLIITVSGWVLAPRPDGIAIRFNEDYGIEGRLNRIAMEQAKVLH
jgi:hypothetical protein